MKETVHVKKAKFGRRMKIKRTRESQKRSMVNEIFCKFADTDADRNTHDNMKLENVYNFQIESANAKQ